jgi:FK506-binding protein 3
MSTEVVPPYKDEELLTDSVSKKDLAAFLQENSSSQFLVEHKLAGAIKNVIKTRTKEQLAEAYKQLFATKSFKTEADVAKSSGGGTGDRKDSERSDDGVEHITQKAKKLDVKEAPKYTKRVIKVGDKKTFPQKGDTVACYYTGKLENGKIFDTNIDDAVKKGTKKAPPPLRFKVGVGKVIRGWDEALLTMSVGERSELVIQPEWAYGKKGLEGKIPPSSTLTFEVELIGFTD